MALNHYDNKHVDLPWSNRPGVTPARKPCKRDLALAAIRVAGYNHDQRTFLRLYVENHISFAKASYAYEQGCAIKDRETRKSNQSPQTGL